MSFDTYSFFLIGLSGFITVWTFRYLTKSEKTAEFEYICLSAFWGIAILAIWESSQSIVKSSPDHIRQFLSNPYAAGFVLSFLGMIFGFVGAHVANFKWFRRMVLFFSPPKENIIKK